jgi:hypothetical protein
MAYLLVVFLPPAALAVAILVDLVLEQRRRRRLYLRPPEATVTLAGPTRRDVLDALERAQRTGRLS